MNTNQSMSYKQRRERDVARTQIIEKLMDSLYISSGMNVRRVDDVSLQKKGVDLVWDEDETIHYVDEKFALNYWNIDLQTFAFELSSNNNVGRQGWFTHDDSLTTDYLLLWVRSNDENFDSIIQAEALLVSKVRIMEFLKLHNIDISILIERLHKEGVYTGRSKRLDIGEGIKVVQSLQFDREQPINLIIPRAMLRQIAQKRMNIS